jgi:indole-3-glycerol phosphate synthase
MNILDTIVAHKRIEVAGCKQRVPVSKLEKEKLFASETLSLKSFLANPVKTGIIAEFKRKSPSKGIINDKVTVEEVTAAYAKYGASGMSILTDKTFFGGSVEDLLAATIHSVPLLRKDFMIDEYQLIEAKAFGADVVLLIAACLAPSEVKTMATTAKRLGLEVLLEIHNEQELAHICEEVDLLGINNRNLKTFEVDINTSLTLINRLPKEKPAVSESGIYDVNTMITLRQAGFKGFLIGESFMKQASPSIAFADFVNQLKAS